VTKFGGKITEGKEFKKLYYKIFNFKKQYFIDELNIYIHKIIING